MNKLSVIVPVYNEENNIRPFLSRMIPVLDKISPSYEVIFILDPSTDNTEEIILEENKNNEKVKLIVMSRRFGQPAATMAGIRACDGEYCVIIDVDLQDPPELVSDMYMKATDGFDVVYAKRKSRQGETIIKKAIAKLGYFLINRLSDISIPENTGDFRIINRKVISHLVQLNESHGFLRGLVAFVGFKQTFIMYDRDARLANNSKYNSFTGSIRIGLNGLIGFSTRPLFIMAVVGFIIALVSFCIGMYYLVTKLSGVPITPGLSTTVILITFFSGIQLLGLGLIGEYIGRIYDEVKNRPMFIVDKKIGFKDK